MNAQLEKVETEGVSPDDVAFEDFNVTNSAGDVLRTLYANPEKYSGGSSKWDLNVSALSEDAGVSNSTAWRTLDDWFDRLTADREGDTIVVHPERDEEPAEAPKVSGEAPIPRERVEALRERYTVLSEEASRELGGHEPEGDLDRALYRNARVRRAMADQLVEDIDRLLSDEEGV